MDEYDTIIIGAGSAGMAAAIYAARFGLRALIIGKVVGGLLNESHNVENYPGFPSIPGFDLMMQFKAHVDKLEVPVVEEWAVGVRVEHYDDSRATRYVVTTKDDGEEEHVYSGRTIIFTNGTKHRHLGAIGEERLQGKGVSYCATCDAAFFRNVPVAIVGGGDSAAQAAALLAQFASKVYVIVRKEKMRAEPINVKRLETNPKVVMVYNNEVLEALGDKQMTGVRLSAPHAGSTTLAVEGMFVEIGADVQSELAAALGVVVNERKEIVIDADSRTNLRGVYAAGDVGNRKYKQALTGAAEGAIAAFSAYELIQALDGGEDVDLSY